MSEERSSADVETETVVVTEDGQLTIPKQFRKRLGIDAPERIRFRDVGDGTLVVERIRSASEMQGFAARSGDSTDVPATECLRTKRSREKSDRDARFSRER